MVYVRNPLGKGYVDEQVQGAVKVHLQKTPELARQIQGWTEHRLYFTVDHGVAIPGHWQFRFWAYLTGG